MDHIRRPAIFTEPGHRSGGSLRVCATGGAIADCTYFRPLAAIEHRLKQWVHCLPCPPNSLNHPGSPAPLYGLVSDGIIVAGADRSRKIEVRMASESVVFEGTWEEMLAHTNELAGRRVRLTIITSDEPFPDIPVDERPSIGASLLQFAGAWSGEDLSDRLDEVYRSRSEAKF